MRVLQVSAELFPLLKTGGLADIAGALPLALMAAGQDVRVLLPGFPAIVAGVTDAVAGGRVDRPLGRARSCCVSAASPAPAPSAFRPTSSTRRASTTGPATPTRMRAASRTATTIAASRCWVGRPRRSRKASIRLGSPRWCTRTTGTRRWRRPTWPSRTGRGRRVRQRLHDPQPGLSRAVRAFAFLRAGLAASCLQRQWARVLRPAFLHEGRSVLRRLHHDGEPDLCARDPDARAGLRPGRPPARPLGRARRHPQRGRRPGLESGHRRADTASLRRPPHDGQGPLQGRAANRSSASRPRPRRRCSCW